MKPDKSTYETPAMLCKMFSTEAGLRPAWNTGMQALTAES